MTGSLTLDQAAVELEAVAALIERPPLDEVLLTESAALRLVDAIRLVLAAVRSNEFDRIAATLWRNLADSDLRMARENCASLRHLARTGRLPSWEELDAAFAMMAVP